jgi:hypothetical protein
VIFLNTLNERSVSSLKTALEAEAGLTQLLGATLKRDQVVALASIPESNVDIADPEVARSGYEVSLDSAIALMRATLGSTGDIVIHDLWAQPSDVRPESREAATVIPARHGLYYRLESSESCVNIVRTLVSYWYTIFLISSGTRTFTESGSFLKEKIEGGLISAFDGESYFFWKNIKGSR